MKINDTQRIGMYRAYAHASDLKTGSASGKKRKDEVQFSAEAMQLLGSLKGADDADRANRIAQLKGEVSAGTYRVPDALLADKLLPFVR